MPPENANDPRNARIAQLAGRQHGVATLTQLNAAGLTRASVRDRVRSGRLHRIHRGVYAVGHSALSQEGRWMAAVVACGPSAVLSHRSAAELHGFLPPSRSTPHVTVTTGVRHRRQGIVCHRTITLEPQQVVSEKAIQVTSGLRTLADLRRTASADIHRRALRQAEYLGFAIEVATPDDRYRPLHGRLPLGEGAARRRGRRLRRPPRPRRIRARPGARPLPEATRLRGTPAQLAAAA